MYDWSAEALRTQADQSVLVINPVIYAEVSIRFERIEELDEAFPADLFRRDHLPWAAAFLAGKAFVNYRRRKGRSSPRYLTSISVRTRQLPDSSCSHAIPAAIIHITLSSS